MQDNKIPHAGEPAHASLRCATNPPHCILVVDDDASAVLLYRDALVHCGYRVDTAEDGAAGWEALQAKSYDLLITDNNMPKVTGVEMIEKIRGRNTALPVILATGAVPEEELRRNPWLQISALLLKPFTVDALLQTVEKVLHVHPPQSPRPGGGAEYWAYAGAGERARDSGYGGRAPGRAASARELISDDQRAMGQVRM